MGLGEILVFPSRQRTQNNSLLGRYDCQCMCLSSVHTYIYVSLCMSVYVVSVIYWDFLWQCSFQFCKENVEWEIAHIIIELLSSIWTSWKIVNKEIYLRENKTKQKKTNKTHTNTTPPPPINKANQNKNQRNTEHSSKWKMIIFTICSWKWFTFKPESKNSLKWRSWKKINPEMYVWF